MIKWAIFQNEYGKDARKYIDNMVDIKNTHLSGLIKESDLPIILNRGLGYCSFDYEYHKKEGFVKIITTDNEFPLTLEEMFPKNSTNFKWGWIDTDGNTYMCDFEDHSYSAEFICKNLKLECRNGERKLEELGWVKISKDTRNYNDNSIAPYSSLNRITKAQYDTLCLIGLGDDWRVKGWFEDSEPYW